MSPLVPVLSATVQLFARRGELLQRRHELIRIGSLKPLDNFLAFLTTFPDPDATCTALLRGPLSPLAAKVGSLWSHSGDDELTMIGAHLHTASARDRYGRVSMQVDLPVVRCISNGEMEVHDLHTITTTFPALALDSSIWQTISDQSQARYIVSQPIFSAGVTIGAISFASGQSRGFIESYEPILSSISSALALWMTHQRMPSALRPATFGAEPVDALRLTPRQRQILLLVPPVIERGRLCPWRYDTSNVSGAELAPERVAASSYIDVDPNTTA